MMIRKRIVLIIPIIFLASLIAGTMKPPIPTEESFASNLFFNYEITRYSSSAEVISLLPGKNITIGVDIGPDNLNFGAIPGNGSTSARFVNLTNLNSKDARIYLEATGTIKPFVFFDKNNFILKSNEKTSINVYFNTTNAVIGNYSGEIYLVVERSKYELF